VIVTDKDCGKARTKNLEARHAVVYENLQECKMSQIRHIGTKHMVADILMKPLGGESFYGFANILMGWIVPKVLLKLAPSEEDKESAEMVGMH
jgi:hypothetical protein